jgi:VanZ family protein
VFRLAAVIAAMVLAWLAFRPSTGADVGLPWDKANHCFAFLVLTVLTGCGWSRLTAWRMAAVMLAAGIAIELVQGLPAVGRDADVWDVVADMVGFALGWRVLVVGRRRGWPGFRE